MDPVNCTRLTTAEVSASACGAAAGTWPVYQSRSELFNNSACPAVSYQAQSSAAPWLTPETNPGAAVKPSCDWTLRQCWGFKKSRSKREGKGEEEKEKLCVVLPHEEPKLIFILKAYGEFNSFTFGMKYISLCFCFGEVDFSLTADSFNY